MTIGWSDSMGSQSLALGFEVIIHSCAHQPSCFSCCQNFSLPIRCWSKFERFGKLARCREGVQWCICYIVCSTLTLHFFVHKLVRIMILGCLWELGSEGLRFLRFKVLILSLRRGAKGLTRLRKWRLHDPHNV